MKETHYVQKTVYCRTEAYVMQEHIKTRGGGGEERVTAHPGSACGLAGMVGFCLNITGKMACTYGHRTDPACSRRTPYWHRLCAVSVRLRTVSVRIGNTSRLCSRCQSVPNTD